LVDFVTLTEITPLFGTPKNSPLKTVLVSAKSFGALMAYPFPGMKLLVVGEIT
jgi:hypothetical protein